MKGFEYSAVDDDMPMRDRPRRAAKSKGAERAARIAVVHEAPHPSEETVAGQSTALLDGLIVDGSRGMYRVETAQGSLTCTIRGRLRKELHYGEGSQKRQHVRAVTVKPHDPVAVGDRVLVTRTDVSSGVIEEVIAREGGAFSRRDPDPHQGRLTTVAGLDQMVIVFAVANPEPHLGLLDRFLAVAEAQGIMPLICINKIDLGVSAELRRRMRVYQQLGYAVLWTSTASGEGLETLRASLAGKVSAMLGKSGVGKSSLLNAVLPGRNERVSSVSDATGKGRHTTTSTRLFPLDGPGGGYLADTAGLRALGLEADVEARLDQYFPEFRSLLGLCHLPDCSHLHEPGCAVRAAVHGGDVDATRYASYRRMRGAEREPWDDLWEADA